MILFSDFQETNKSLSAAFAYSVNLTKQLQDCNTRADIAELRARAVVEGGDAIAHVVEGLKDTVIALERGFNESKSAALHEAVSCYAALRATHTRGILTVFLTYIGPCTLAPVAMFVLLVCSSGSTSPSRTWLFISKALVVTAYTSWVIPHVMDSSFLSLESSSAHSRFPYMWTDTLGEHIYSHFSAFLLPSLPRTPAHFFIIGSCTFALALAVQGTFLPRINCAHYKYSYSAQGALSSENRPPLSSLIRHVIVF